MAVAAAPIPSAVAVAGAGAAEEAGEAVAEAAEAEVSRGGGTRSGVPSGYARWPARCGFYSIPACRRGYGLDDVSFGFRDASMA